MSERVDNRVGWLRGVALRVAVVAFAFALVMTGLTLREYWNFRAAPPLPSRQLEELRQRLASETQNETLAIQARALDLRLRRHHFRVQARIRLGIALLATGFLVGAVGMIYRTATVHRFPNLGQGGLIPHADRESFNAYLQSVGGGVLMAALAGIALFAGGGEEGVPAAAPTPPIEAEPPAVEIGTPRALLAKEWVALRGLDGRAIGDRSGTPTRWEGRKGTHVRWKRAVEMPGFSSPVVFGGQVFLTGGDQTLRVLYAFDTETGALNWKHEVSGIDGSPVEAPEVTEDTGYAAPTVAVDGERVFAIFATGDLVCTDLAGKRIWVKNLGVPENHYAHSSSLLAWRNLLFIQYDHGTEQVLFAFDGATGEIVWSVDRESEISWSSPVLVDGDANDAFLVINAAPNVAAYRARDGEELWNVEAMSGEVGPSATFDDKHIYVANDGASLVALDRKTGAIVWETDEPAMPDAASPLCVNGVIIMPTGMGVVSGIRASDGKLLWEHEHDKGFYASPVAVGNRVYMTDLNGLTFVVEPGETWKEVAKNPLGEAAAATPAFVGKRIYLRGFKHLYCIETTQ
ncbi:MAG: outer membrane protein assembly factor BamB family protein [Planctomycetota bacterium]